MMQWIRGTVANGTDLRSVARLEVSTKSDCQLLWACHTIVTLAFKQVETRTRHGNRATYVCALGRGIACGHACITTQVTDEPTLDARSKVC